MIFLFLKQNSRKRNRQASVVNSSKSNSSLDSKLNQKYSTRASTDAIHTLANGHQQILHSTLPRDSKWEKKKVRALNQDLFAYDHKSSMKSLILGTQTPTPPLPPMQSNLYPLPLLSLPNQANMNNDLFEDNQPESDAFFLNHNLNHARHHMHMHHQQHLLDQLEPVVEQSNDLLLSNLNNQNSINYQILNSRTPISNTSLLPADVNIQLPSSFPATTCTNDSYLFNQTENTNCSHCAYEYGYELYDCNNLNEMAANNSCNLMLLPSSNTSYHHIHHPMYANLHNEYHSCDTQAQFNNNWPNADLNQLEQSTNSNHHIRPHSKHQDHIQDRLKSTLLEDDLAEESMIDNTIENNYKSSNQTTQMNQVKSDEKQMQNKDEDLVKSTNDKSNQLNETSEERSSSNSNNSKNTRLQQPKLLRTQSFTVEEVDLSEN